MYQIHKKDEYNQFTIEGREDSLELAIQKLRNAITDDNLDNAIVLDDQIQDSDSYGVFFFLNETSETPLENFIYGGPTAAGGKHKILCLNDKSEIESVVVVRDFEELKINHDITAKFYLGTDKTNEKHGITLDHWVQDEHKKGFLTKENSVQLEGKNLYFLVHI